MVLDNPVAETLQAEMLEEKEERSRHQEMLMKSYFNQHAGIRENEMFALAIKYVENLQEMKRDGSSVSVVPLKSLKQRQLANVAREQHLSTKVISCIFKANDDLRQDILAL